MISFHVITSEEHNRAVLDSKINDDAIYFLKDTKDIYKGATKYGTVSYEDDAKIEEMLRGIFDTLANRIKADTEEFMGSNPDSSD